MLDNLTDEELDGLEEFVTGLLEALGYDSEDPDDLRKALNFLAEADPSELKGVPPTDRKIFEHDRETILDVIRAWIELEGWFE